ncbi:hypothetical protein GCM10023178_05000 [Actinomadura luteofluorescens]
MSFPWEASQTERGSHFITRSVGAITQLSGRGEDAARSRHGTQPAEPRRLGDMPNGVGIEAIASAVAIVLLVESGPHTGADDYATVGRWRSDSCVSPPEVLRLSGHRIREGPANGSATAGRPHALIARSPDALRK